MELQEYVGAAGELTNTLEWLDPMELRNSEAISHPRDFGPGGSHGAVGQERGNHSSRGRAGLEGDGWEGSAYSHKATSQTNLNESPQHQARPLIPPSPHAGGRSRQVNPGDHCETQQHLTITPTMGRRPRIALRAEAPKAHINPHSTLWHNVYSPEYLESKDFSPGFGIVAETFLHCEGHRLFLSHLFRGE